VTNTLSRLWCIRSSWSQNI